MAEALLFVAFAAITTYLFAPREEQPMATLYINPASSRCGACNQPADPDESQHLTSPDWDETRPGCGAVYDAVSSDSTPPEAIVRYIKSLYPGLPYITPANNLRDSGN